jgi:predicted Zn-dependent protease with MMP-like domain
MTNRCSISPDAFARLVKRAIKELPLPYAKLMESIVVVIEEEPPPDVLEDLEIGDEDELLGLYQGQSLVEESFFSTGGTEPAKISIYRGPILRQCHSEEEIVREVYETVMHELGHHVGLDDDEMPY